MLDLQFIDLNIEVVLALPTNTLAEYLAANFGQKSEVQSPMLDLDLDELRAMSGEDVYEPRGTIIGNVAAAATQTLSRISSRIQSRT